MSSLPTLLKHVLLVNTSHTKNGLLANNSCPETCAPSPSTAALFCPAKVSELPLQSQKCLQQCSAQFTLHLRSNTSRTRRPLGVMHYLHFIAYMKSAVLLIEWDILILIWAKGCCWLSTFLRFKLAMLNVPCMAFWEFDLIKEVWYFSRIILLIVFYKTKIKSCKR